MRRRHEPRRSSGLHEAIGLANYTVAQNQETGLLELKYKPDTFEIEFQSCQGWDYSEKVTPEQYQEADNVWHLGLRHRSNDLSAFVFKQYLEGKTNKKYTNHYEETVVGYKHPEVNNNDIEREKVCKAKFQEKFPGKAWEKVVIEEEEEE